MKKTVLITGATSGIGEACARRFAEGGYNIIITGRNAEKLSSLAAELKAVGAQVRTLTFDVRDAEAAVSSIASLEEGWRNIDVLINNAGLALGLEKEYEGDPEDWNTMIDTNIKGLLTMTRLIVPRMVERNRGHIINIGSLQSFRAFPNGAPYGASKGGVAQMTRAMAEAWSRPGTGIVANAVAPGFFKTQLTAPLFDRPEVIKALARQTTIGRVGTAEDMQGLTVFLASPASDYITGQIISVDGGWTAI